MSLPNKLTTYLPSQSTSESRQVNYMHNATFGRTRYLAGNILELQVLAKLYGIPPFDNPKYRINWVDALVEYLPEAKVVTWGELADKANYKARKCQELIVEALGCIDGTNNPNVIQLAIMAQLIELRAKNTNLTIDSIVDLQGLEGEEKLVCSQNWQLYQLRQVLTEALEIAQSIV